MHSLCVSLSCLPSPVAQPDATGPDSHAQKEDEGEEHDDEDEEKDVGEEDATGPRTEKQLGEEDDGSAPHIKIVTQCGLVRWAVMASYLFACCLHRCQICRASGGQRTNLSYRVRRSRAPGKRQLGLMLLSFITHRVHPLPAHGNGQCTANSW